MRQINVIDVEREEKKFRIGVDGSIKKFSCRSLCSFIVWRVKLKEH